MGQRCKNWQKVWQSPEELHVSQLILFNCSSASGRNVWQRETILKASLCS